MNFMAWYLVGIAATQLTQWFRKDGLFSKKKVYTLGDCFVEMMFALLGPLMVVMMIWVVEWHDIVLYDPNKKKDKE